MAKKKATRRANLASFESATEAQRTRIIEMLRLSRRGVAQSIFLLKLRTQAVDVTLEELDDINAELGDLEAEEAKVKAKILAFIVHGARLRPPTAAMVNKLLSVVDTLDLMVAASTTAGEVLDVVTELISTVRDATPDRGS